MNRNNIKLLTKDQLKEFRLRYSFDLDESRQNVVVYNRAYNRRTIHKCSEGFSLNSTIRKLTFWPEAIQAWKEFINGGRIYNLLDIQDCAMILAKSYQPTDAKNIKQYFYTVKEL